MVEDKVSFSFQCLMTSNLIILKLIEQLSGHSCAMTSDCWSKKRKENYKALVISFFRPTIRCHSARMTAQLAEISKTFIVKR